MPRLYRVAEPLLRKGGDVIREGSLTTLSWLSKKSIERLVQLGRVSDVAAPPLEVLPGWGKVAEILKNKLGMIDVLEFVEGDVQELSEALRVAPTEIKNRQKQALSFLQADGILDSLEFEVPAMEEEGSNVLEGLSEEEVDYLLPQDNVT